MSGYTKGPWELKDAADEFGECKELTALDGKLTGMAMIYSPCDENLIAAAPELLECLVAYVNACEFQGIKLGAITGDACAAIAKATGQSGV